MTIQNRLTKLEKQETPSEPEPMTEVEAEHLRAKIAERLDEILDHPEENAQAAKHLDDLIREWDINALKKGD